MPSERSLCVRIEERIDHRQAVVEHVGERDRHQRAGAAAVDRAVGAAQAVFHQPRLDVAVLHHHGVVEHRHVGHAAVAVAAVEIAAEHGVLLGGRHQRAHLADHVGVALGDAAHAAGRAEFVGDDAHRDAGAAGLAGRPVGDRLAAAEAAVGEQVVEPRRAVADQVREHLALLLARQIGARRGRGQVELRRVARMLGHGTLSAVRREPAQRAPSLTGNVASKVAFVKGLKRGQAGRRTDARKALARCSLLITTVPTRMSCRQRRRSLIRQTTRISGVNTDTVIQNTMACTAPSTK